MNCPLNSGDLLKGGKAGNKSIGEVVCWKGHVGIYDGAGNVIHAYGTNNGCVKINSVNDVCKWNNKQVVGYRRYF